MQDLTPLFLCLASSTFTNSERQLIATVLPFMRDWYVQAGNSGLANTDNQNRGAFMLDGLLSDGDNRVYKSADKKHTANDPTWEIAA